MTRRELLKLLALGLAGYNLDLDRLLWVPGAKKIFLPSPKLSFAQIVEAEMAQVFPRVADLFNRDDVFYKMILARNVEMISSREMRIPLIIKPGEKA